jgi:anti-sigma28 factor (negative regulator of flagellin synthesis)
MKDIVRLEAASASSNASARLYAPPQVAVPQGQAGQRSSGPHDTVSVSSAAQSLSERAAAMGEGASTERLASLQALVLADTLEIDLHGIADHLLGDMSRE